ncbi:hypothetical protein [Cellulomonas sp. ES6]|nr:hypothetical protein [Cellulomonas sp. ES6]WHP16150.1 hypothetical protein P9841_10885 [Cellulomonas sp. ES6]
MLFAMLGARFFPPLMRDGKSISRRAGFFALGYFVIALLGGLSLLVTSA